VLEERLEEIDAEFQSLAEERGTGKASLKREKPAEKVEEAIDKLDERITIAKLQMVDREAGKEIALGTRSAHPSLHVCSARTLFC
jgi:DNA topoisomerase-1